MRHLPAADGASMWLSCHFITWKNDFLGAIEDVKSLGFTACEPALRFVRRYAVSPEDFAALLRQHGLAVSALYESGSFTSGVIDVEEMVQRYTDVARLVRACGSEVLVVGPAMSRSDGPPTPDGLRRAAKILDEVGRACADAGIKACLHPHLWSEVQTREEIDALMEGTGNDVWLCVDTGHLAGAGVDPVEMIDIYGARLGHVHLKDLTPDGETGARPSDAPGVSRLPFCELGKGSITLPRVIGALGRTGYGGWVTIELDDTRSAPRKALEVCRDYAVGQLGLNLDVSGDDEDSG